MSHFVTYILKFQEIIVYKIPPGRGGGYIASLWFKNFDVNRKALSPICCKFQINLFGVILYIFFFMI